jgi:hypothetical protein
VPYANKTKVPVMRSREQLETLLHRRGAEGFASSWDADQNRIEFLRGGVRVRFVLPRSKLKHETAREQDERRRWRALILVIKAKLEAVDSGISVFEEEFLAHIVDPASSRTVGELLVPRIQAGAANLLLVENPRSKGRPTDG